MISNHQKLDFYSHKRPLFRWESIVCYTTFSSRRSIQLCNQMACPVVRNGDEWQINNNKYYGKLWILGKKACSLPTIFVEKAQSRLISYHRPPLNLNALSLALEAADRDRNPASCPTSPNLGHNNAVTRNTMANNTVSATITNIYMTKILLL